MVVGTIGDAVPVEVLVAAGAEIVPIVGAPGGSTVLVDRYVEPMVGPRARSQLQRVLDGTYSGLDLVLLAREHDAQLRLFHTLREIRRTEPELGLPETRVLDLQHTGTPAAAAWNQARVRELCSALGVDAEALRDGIRRCNDGRRAQQDRRSETDKRVLVTGSAHADTRLGELIAAAGGTVVEAPPVLAGEDGDPFAALARRYEHPLLAGARGSTTARAAAVAEAAQAVSADVVVAFSLDGEDGYRWELPELRAAVEAAGIPLVVHDRQPYDVDGLVLDV